MKAVDSSETSENVHQNAFRHFLYGGTINIHLYSVIATEMYFLDHSCSYVYFYYEVLLYVQEESLLKL
jgi:hypothetical protein